MQQEQPTPDLFRALEHRRTQALVGRDMKTRWQLHSADYMLISPPGRTLTREQYLGRIDEGTLNYLRWEPEDMQVRVTAHMGIVRYRVTLELASHDGSPSTPFSCAGTPTRMSSMPKGGKRSGHRQLESCREHAGSKLSPCNRRAMEPSAAQPGVQPDPIGVASPPPPGPFNLVR